MATKKKKAKKAKAKPGRFNMILDPALKKWAQEYADRHHTTVTAIITGYLVHLREAEREINVEQI